MNEKEPVFYDRFFLSHRKLRFYTIKTLREDRISGGYIKHSGKGSFLSCLTAAAFVFCLVKRDNHTAAFAKDAALFLKTDDGDKEKHYLIELAAKGLGRIMSAVFTDRMSACSFSLE